MDPCGYDATKVFLEKLQACGSLTYGWSCVFGKLTRLRYSEFEKVCVAANIPEPKKIFRWLESRGVVCAETCGVKWLDAHRIVSPKQDKKAMLDHLRRVCVKQYGSMLKAWRNGFDPYNHGSIPYSVFANVCRTLNVSESVWKMLSPFGRHALLTLEDFDLDSHNLFSSFEKLLDDTCGCLTFGWVALFDTDDLNLVNCEVFQSRLLFLGYRHDAAKLFQSLTKAKTLCLEDIDRKAADEIWRNGPPGEAITLKDLLGKRWLEEEEEQSFVREALARAVSSWRERVQPTKTRDLAADEWPRNAHGPTQASSIWEYNKLKVKTMLPEEIEFRLH